MNFNETILASFVKLEDETLIQRLLLNINVISWEKNIETVEFFHLYFEIKHRDIAINKKKEDLINSKFKNIYNNYNYEFYLDIYRNLRSKVYLQDNIISDSLNQQNNLFNQTKSTYFNERIFRELGHLLDDSGRYFINAFKCLLSSLLLNMFAAFYAELTIRSVVERIVNNSNNLPIGYQNFDLSKTFIFIVIQIVLGVTTLFYLFMAAKSLKKGGEILLNN